MENFVNIQIPPPLKKQLVDDCEFITHLGKVVLFYAVIKPLYSIKDVYSEQVFVEVLWYFY